MILGSQITIHLSIWAVICFIGFAHGVFLTVAFLVIRRGRRLANVFLASMIWVFTMVIGVDFLIAAGLVEKAPRLMFITFMFPSSIGPLYYYYTRTFFQPDYTPRAIVVIPLVLVAPLFNLAVGLHRHGPGPEWIVSYLNFLRAGGSVPFHLSSWLIMAADVVFMLVFIHLARRVIRQTESRMLNESSGSEYTHIVWMRVFNYGFYVVMAATVAQLAAAVIVYRLESEMILITLECLLVHSIGIAALLHPEAFYMSLAMSPVKARRDPIAPETARDYLAKLISHMEENKPYRNPDLRISDLAAQVDVPSGVLSQVINETCGTNFFNFINRYRIEEAQKLLADVDNDQYTILAIARDAGFSSKASFNRVFKNVVGMSPSEYKHMMRADESPA